jgi:hypothetical protein
VRRRSRSRALLVREAARVNSACFFIAAELGDDGLERIGAGRSSKRLGLLRRAARPR